MIDEPVRVEKAMAMNSPSCLGHDAEVEAQLLADPGWTTEVAAGPSLLACWWAASAAASS